MTAGRSVPTDARRPLESAACKRSRGRRGTPSRTAARRSEGEVGFAVLARVASVRGDSIAAPCWGFLGRGRGRVVVQFEI